MSYMMIIGSCWSCKQRFSFSAERVPSIVFNGVRQPICRDCIALANVTRAETGLPPIGILSGAYDADEVG